MLCCYRIFCLGWTTAVVERRHSPARSSFASLAIGHLSPDKRKQGIIGVTARAAVQRVAVSGLRTLSSQSRTYPAGSTDDPGADNSISCARKNAIVRVSQYISRARALTNDSDRQARSHLFARGAGLILCLLGARTIRADSA